MTWEEGSLHPRALISEEEPNPGPWTRKQWQTSFRRLEAEYESGRICWKNLNKKLVGRNNGLMKLVWIRVYAARHCVVIGQICDNSPPEKSRDCEGKGVC